MKNKLKSYLFLAVLAGVIIVLDQFTKNLVRMNLAYGEVWSPWEWLTPYARVVHWYNTGVAFGLFQGYGLLFTFLPMVVVVFILIFYSRLAGENWWMRVAIGLELGGAVGNLIDRIRIGHVTDFISVGNFAVFNVADASITVGVVVMIIALWVEEKKNPSQSE
ncbi:MAG TPA: signal peptidase II [Anaerolineaceae bacterium]|uniref:Lipoprotein signal peptidase n=1 Tax=Anaerolinea thermophila TaxID=167964 RepID=A0A101FY84_9CHLR|nr:MAG: lipoprotein signal peptidase [Anaerolinea thermophila]HAF62173.1 signal peptidase II [Anaerolineaceae bacterium]